MNQLDEISAQLDSFFNKVLVEDMAGLPLLNENIKVEIVCFQIYEERPIGIVIAPWLMSLVMFPNEEDDWSAYKIGDRQDHEFPSGERKFLINEFEGIGICQSLAIHSPMADFKSQEHARLTAHVFMKKLMIPIDPDDQLDEKRLERFIEGEEMAEIHQSEKISPPAATDVSSKAVDSSSVEIARSDFIRGKFRGHR